MSELNEVNNDKLMVLLLLQKMGEWTDFQVRERLTYAFIYFAPFGY